MRVPTTRHPQVFKTILEGPFSQYGIYIKLNKKIRTGTIYKILNILQKGGYIRSYQLLIPEEKGKLEKDLWGPTIIGISEFYWYDPSIQVELDVIFDRWSKYPEFQKELENMGFDRAMIKNQTGKVRDAFKKFIIYLAGVRKQIMKLVNEPKSFDRKTLYAIGEFLFIQNPENEKMLQELYTAIPGIKKDLDASVRNLMTKYRRFKQEATKN